VIESWLGCDEVRVAMQQRRRTHPEDLMNAGILSESVLTGSLAMVLGLLFALLRALS
jgi:hypothetical protein